MTHKPVKPAEQQKVEMALGRKAKVAKADVEKPVVLLPEDDDITQPAKPEDRPERRHEERRHTPPMVEPETSKQAKPVKAAAAKTKEKKVETTKSSSHKSVAKLPKLKDILDKATTEPDTAPETIPPWEDSPVASAAAEATPTPSTVSPTHELGHTVTSLPPAQSRTPFKSSHAPLPATASKPAAGSGGKITFEEAMASAARAVIQPRPVFDPTKFFKD